MEGAGAAAAWEAAARGSAGTEEPGDWALFGRAGAAAVGGLLGPATPAGACGTARANEALNAGREGPSRLASRLTELKAGAAGSGNADETRAGARGARATLSTVTGVSEEASTAGNRGTASGGIGSEGAARGASARESNISMVSGVWLPGVDAHEQRSAATHAARPAAALAFIGFPSQKNRAAVSRGSQVPLTCSEYIPYCTPWKSRSMY